MLPAWSGLPRAGVVELGARAIDGWVEIIAAVYARGGLPRREAKTKAQLLVAAMEGALLLARIRQSTRPIMEIAAMR